MADARHRREELLQPRRIGVQRLERVRGRRASTSFCGWPVRKRLGQAAPERIEPGVRHLEDAADIRRLVPVEEQIGLRSVRVARRRSASRNPRATSVSRKSRDDRAMQAQAGRAGASCDSGPRASSVKTPISTALSSVFAGQNAKPVCRIFSGVSWSGTMAPRRWVWNGIIDRITPTRKAVRRRYRYLPPKPSKAPMPGGCPSDRGWV